MCLEGSQLDTFESICLDEDDPLLNASIPGYIGNGYEFYVEGGLKEPAELFFEIDESILSDENIDPAIFYLNEETQLFEEVEGQQKTENGIRVSLEHFSKYIVLDRNSMADGEYGIEPHVSEGGIEDTKEYDYIYVHELPENKKSFSEYYYTRNEIANFIYDHDIKMCITEGYVLDDITYRMVSEEYMYSLDLSTDYTSRHLEYTPLYRVVEAVCRNFYSLRNDGKEKILIFFSDGYEMKNSAGLEEAISLAKENALKVYTIGRGDANFSEMEAISEATGGRFVHIDDKEDVYNSLYFLFDVEDEIEVETEMDSDEDGLSDYYENLIAEGKIKLGTGASFTGYEMLDPYNPDSDGDGLPDGEEIEIRKLPDFDEYYVYMYSNPCMVDTDGDTYDDQMETSIGLSSLSRNIRTAQGYVSAFGRPVKINKKFELKQLKWRGLVHNMVQDIIVDKYPDIDKEEGVPGAGRCDLIKKDSGHIWEVKPSTVLYNDSELRRPLKQLDRYVNNTIGGKRGDLYIADAVEDDDKYDFYIEYYNMGEGIILYYFEKKSDHERKKAMEVISQSKDKDNNDLETKYTQVIDIKQGVKDVAAIVVLGVIVGNDIPSAGMLTVDDVFVVPIVEYLVSRGYAGGY